MARSCVIRGWRGHDSQALLAAMEQGEVAVARAGICAALPARAAVIGAANPVLSTPMIHICCMTVLTIQIQTGLQTAANADRSAWTEATCRHNGYGAAVAVGSQWVFANAGGRQLEPGEDGAAESWPERRDAVAL